MAVDDVVVRGSIDLWFEEAGELILVDYKTDRGKSGPSRRAVRRSAQRYRGAGEIAAACPIWRRWSWGTGEVVPIPLAKPICRCPRPSPPSAGAGPLDFPSTGSMPALRPFWASCPVPKSCCGGAYAAGIAVFGLQPRSSAFSRRSARRPNRLRFHALGRLPALLVDRTPPSSSALVDVFLLASEVRVCSLSSRSFLEEPFAFIVCKDVSPFRLKNRVNRSPVAGVPATAALDGDIDRFNTAAVFFMERSSTSRRTNTVRTPPKTVHSFI